MEVRETQTDRGRNRDRDRGVFQQQGKARTNFEI